jgi:hypothetical protein
MTLVLLVGKEVYLNPPDEGKIGITCSSPESFETDKEAELFTFKIH